MTQLFNVFSATALLLLPTFSANAIFFDFDTIESSSDTFTLSNTTASDWWYGCSATSAGMLMAYYDTNGYKGYSFSNLVPGTAGSTATGAWPNGQNLRSIVASTGYQHDYYNADTYGYNNGGGTIATGYNASGDDLVTTRSADCLADFMGTGQDAYGQSNGSTSYYYYTEGDKLYTSDLVSFGLEQNIKEYYSGNLAAGIEDYIEYCGYSVSYSFTQVTDNFLATLSITGGFTFEDYVAEILAERPVLLSCSSSSGGHTMIGIGYEEEGNIVELCDTWDGSIHTMAWDGTYSDYELSIAAVFVLELALVPEPATWGLLAAATAFVGTVIIRRRSRAA